MDATVCAPPMPTAKKMSEAGVIKQPASKLSKEFSSVTQKNSSKRMRSPSAPYKFPEDANNLDDFLDRCYARDERCARLTGARSLAQLASKFADPNQHVFADVVGDGVKGADCPKRGLHHHIHSHFYSVADAQRSKRRIVPVFLFWKHRLGWTFPVTANCNR